MRSTSSRNWASDVGHPLRAAALAAVLGAALGVHAAEHVVTIEGMAFKPATLTIKRGDSVSWQNQDLVPHTATAAGRFDSGSIAQGKRWRFTPKTAGRYDYACTYHPGMKAVVVVE